MAQQGIQLIGFKELNAAVKRNPDMVRRETKLYLQRGLSKYKKGVTSRPWRVGALGGGAPVSNDPRYPRGLQRQKSGALRDSHVTKISGFTGTYGPNPHGQARKYMEYVHDGTPRGQMKARPWLDHVYKENQHRLRSLEKELLKNITADLAK